MNEISRDKLVSYLDGYLNVKKIRDYCPNGLQVEGSSSIRKIVGGVTACQDLIDYAIEADADAIIVHHGYFWKGEAAEVVGIKKRRLKSLLENDINLLAYHLPLDMHEEVGNNAQLVKCLGLTQTGALEPGNPQSVGIKAELTDSLSAGEFNNLVSERLGRECFHIGSESKMIKTLGICSGAAQGMIEFAVNESLDAYLSGEISEQTVHIARESGVNFFSAGHHATEKGGVMALGSHLEEKFGVKFEFVDIANPV